MQKTILVTGCSRGIGQEIVRQLQARAQVIATARVMADLKWTEGGGPILVLPLDVAERESIRALFTELKERQIQLDVVIHNAGIYGGSRFPASPRQIFATNYYGPLALTESLWPQLAPEARIVAISSGMGELSGFSARARKALLGSLSVSDLQAMIERYLEGDRMGWPDNPYSASKGALNTLIRIWQKERPEFTFVSVCPGWVRTDMGGREAPRSVEKGAETAVWAALTPSLAGGRFYRDRAEIPW